MNFTELRIKIRNFIKKNRRLILIIVLLWLIIFLINLLLGFRKEEPVATTTYEPHVSVMDSSKSTPKSLQNPIEEKIKNYVDACNEGNFEKAYNMLSDDCKTYSFDNNIQNYVTHVKVKMPMPKKYFIQDYSETKLGNKSMYIYEVRYTDDFLATGLTNSNYSYIPEKFVFYRDSDGVLQMNIGDFLYHEDIKSISENEYLKVDVADKVVEYEIERYNVKFTNRSDKTIVISDNQEADEVLLVLPQETRKLEGVEKIVLKPGESLDKELTFSKYADDGDVSQSILFSSLRIMENYSGTEDVSEDIIKQEIDNAIKMSMEVKVDK